MPNSDSITINKSGAIERCALAIGGAGLCAFAMKKATPVSALLAIAGGDLIYHGMTGNSFLLGAVRGQGLWVKPGKSASIPYRQGIRVDKSIVIEAPREKLYTFWRNLENLPRFLRHLRSVTKVNDRVSHWVAEAPGHTTAQWDAEIVNEAPNERIGWRSLPGSEVDTAGSVQFKPVLGAKSTEVIVELQYDPPGGVFGAALAKLMGEDPADQIEQDLRQLKHMVESGQALPDYANMSGYGSGLS